jgi:hypothetical protein
MIKNKSSFLQAKDTAVKFSDTVLSSISEYMEGGNQEGIQPEFKKYKDQKKVSEVSLLNQNGEIKRSSDRDQLGLKLNQRNIEDAFNGRDSIMLTLGDPGRGKLLIVSRSILNKEQCFRCHDREKKFLGVLKTSFDWTPVETEIKINQQRTIMFSLLGFAIVMSIVIVYLKNFVP